MSLGFHTYFQYLSLAATSFTPPLAKVPRTAWRTHIERDFDARFGFAPDFDAPIPYMQRTRDYYAAIGYTTPYRWAHYVEAPFQPLKKPLREARLTVITTAAPFRPDKGDQGPGAPYNSA